VDVDMTKQARRILVISTVALLSWVLGACATSPATEQLESALARGDQWWEGANDSNGAEGGAGGSYGCGLMRSSAVLCLSCVRALPRCTVSVARTDRV